MKSLLILLSTLSFTCGYKILCVFPIPSRSHTALAKGIVKPLLEAGHQVTWLTPFPDVMTHKNLKLIDGSATLVLAREINMIEMANAPPSFVEEFAINVTSITVNNKVLREVLTKEQFDAVVTEWFMSDTEVGYAAVQQVPWIVLSSMLQMPHIENFVEDVRSVPTIPIIFNDFPIPMSFTQRVANTALFLAMLFKEQLSFPTLAQRYESYFASIAKARNVPLPPLKDVATNVSILLLNSHPSITPAMSIPPNAVEIAGYHIEEAQPLPKDVKEILDNSPQGVVYFSMGSVVKSALLPAHTRQELISMFEDIPYTVLWKFEEDIEGLPKNIVVRKWWPQAAVLAHPNVKLFITHGGLLSTLEAVHYGVPLLAIPVFGDQPSNAARAERSGYARFIRYDDNMGPGLKVLLNEMLSTDKYYNQAKYLSKMFTTRPVHPSKLVSHYIELAIESKGAYHLRSKSYLYAWYQRWMLDQLAALLALLITVYVLIKKLICFIFCRQSKSKNSKKVKKN